MKAKYIGWIAAAAAAWGVYSPGDKDGAEPRLFTPHLYDGGRPVSISASVPHNYDVKKYTISLRVDDVQKTISGTTTIRLMSSVANLKTVKFHLQNDMAVSAVKQGNASCAYDHTGGVLTVTLAQAKNAGETFDLAVTYAGHPTDGFYFTNKGFYVTSAMEEAQHWFPCYDLPSDKADSSELIITCRKDWYVAANGELVETKNNPDNTVTYRWLTNYRIATYLISVSGAYEYSNFGTTWMGMPVTYYVFPEHRSAAEVCFSRVPDMINYFSNRFWRYPFWDERYGIAEAEMGYFGGMENQTCITLNRYYVRPDHSADNVLAHELSHMWWGDCISPGTWADLWLNEGLATYCDALWVEHDKGKDAFQERMQYFAQVYFNEDQYNRFPVYNPTSPWSATVYEKGAWIMHMLRRRLGDEAFFRAWNKYGRDHEYGHAVTLDLQRYMENEYNQNLDEFFEDWVYKAGYPVYEYDWTAAGNGVTVNICQVQQQTPITPLFDTPVDLTITTQNDGVHVETVWVKDRNHRFQFNYNSPVTDVEFDKDGWLLCKKTLVTGVGITSFAARPTGAGIELRWETSPGSRWDEFDLLRSPVRGEGGRHKVNDAPIRGRPPFRFLDADVKGGGEYEYWLEATDAKGRREVVGPATARAPEKPVAFALFPHTPNPVRSDVCFRFALAVDGEASLAVYDLAGREVWRTRGHYRRGENVVRAALDVPPGVYLYRLTSGGEGATRKMVVVK